MASGCHHEEVVVTSLVVVLGVVDCVVHQGDVVVDVVEVHQGTVGFELVVVVDCVDVVEVHQGTVGFVVVVVEVVLEVGHHSVDDDVVCDQDGVELLDEAAPLSTPVVSTGAGGVTGSGGFSQFVREDLSVSPSPRLIAVRSGNEPWQQVFVKSSRSIVHATTPP